MSGTGAPLVIRATPLPVPPQARVGPILLLPVAEVVRPAAPRVAVHAQVVPAATHQVHPDQPVVAAPAPPPVVAAPASPPAAPAALAAPAPAAPAQPVRALAEVATTPAPVDTKTKEHGHKHGGPGGDNQGKANGDTGGTVAGAVPEVATTAPAVDPQAPPVPDPGSGGNGDHGGHGHARGDHHGGG